MMRTLHWLVLFAAVFSVHPAQAGNPCKGLKGKKFRKCLKEARKNGTITFNIAEVVIAPTEVKAIDDVFEPVKSIIDELRESTVQIQTANATIGKALGQEQCETLSEVASGFAKRVQGELTLTMSTVEIPLMDPAKLVEMQKKFEAKGKKIPPKLLDRIPKMSVPMPSLASKKSGGQIGQVVQAVNDAVQATSSIVQTCATIPTRLQSTVAQATLLPAKAPRAIRKQKLTKERGAEVLQIMQENVMVVLALPKLALSTLKELQGMFALVSGLVSGEVPMGTGGFKEIQAGDGNTYRKLKNDYIRVNQPNGKYRCLRPKDDGDSRYQEALRLFNR